MATPTELARRIRFELSELSGHDGHHEFESLCRELARARFVSNILPATGPVAVGGPLPAGGRGGEEENR